MKRAALLALALALVATDVAAAAPARLLVEAREFNLTLSRGKQMTLEGWRRPEKKPK